MKKIENYNIDYLKCNVISIDYITSLCRSKKENMKRR